MTLFAAISAVTKNIGFIATASTTYEEPYLLARKYASLNHISKGHAAWNVVTTISAETARNFGFSSHPDTKVRYERADEFIEVVQKLWDSWEDDAFLYDKESGHFFEAAKQHEPLHQGKYFNVQGVSVFVAKTEHEAKEKYALLNSLIHPDVGLGLLSGLAGDIDLSHYDLDAPFPIEDIKIKSSRQQMMLEITAKHHFSIRQLYEYIASARGHWTLIGTPEQVVDQLQEWFENEAADGFNVLPPTTPAGLDDFVNFIIPELQRRGLFLTEYEGSTLRENLGLKRPVNQYLVTQPNTAIAS